MEKKVLDFAIEKTRELMDAPTCSKEAKAAAQAWLEAVGTPVEAAVTAAYIAELEADIMTADGLAAFAESEMGAKLFGAEKAVQVAAHAHEIKAAGGMYRDCPACAAAAAILGQKEAMLK